jgi:diaminopimelate decarboxylase
MAALTELSAVFPLDSGVDARGRLQIGGCDALELAREVGTPAYVVAEEDLRSRARAFMLAAGDAVRADGPLRELGVVFASKAFPCTAVLSLFAEEGLWCDVASGGELHLALRAGVPAQRLVVHGNAKSLGELRQAVAARAGLVVLDNLDEVERLAATVRELNAPPQPVLVRVTPDVRGETHEKISTGQADSKFGFSMADAAQAIARARLAPELDVRGLHAHVGSQLLDLAPFTEAAAALGTLGAFPTCDLGGGLGVAYAPEDEPPSIEAYVAAVVAAAGEHLGAELRTLLIEPGRALTANAGVTLYTVESVKRNVSLWVAVDGGMSDNMRPMLYGSRYEAHVVDRLFGAQECRLAGKHCESGDVLVREALLDEPRVGDVIVTPATGAYGYAMANNYNGVPRAPVVFCRDGEARLVVRRETFADLEARDVRP